MPVINRASDATNMTWKLVDAESGQANGAIDWTFRVGDRVKIRLVNGMEQDHPMHHPFHIHGAGRFLVLSRDDQPEDNLVWKDTVLVRPAETVDILLEVTNPGRWMAHCHIAAHELDGQDLSHMDPTVDWAGGGLVSTAADLAALLRSLTRGDLVSASAWRQMTRRYCRTSSVESPRER